MIHIGSKFVPWGFRMKLKELRFLNGHIVMFDTFIMYLVYYCLGSEQRMRLTLDYMYIVCSRRRNVYLLSGSD